MPNWHRRTVLTTGAALSTTSVLASITSTAVGEDEDGDEDEVPAPSSSVPVGDPDGWSSAWGNAANSNYLPLEDEFPKPDTVAWRYELPDLPSWHDGKVAVVDGRIYLLTNSQFTDERIGGVITRHDTELHALDAETGDLEWKTEVDASGRPTVANGLVYVSGRDLVTAYDTADGSLEWEREFDTEEWVPSTTAANGMLYVVAGKTLYAIDGEDGSTRWQREQVEVRPANDEAADPVPTTFETVEVAVVDESVYAVTHGTEYGEGDSDTFESNGGVAALDATTGEDQWAIALEDGIDGPLMATEEFIFGAEALDVDYGPILDPDTGDLVRRDATRTRAATPDARVAHDPTYPGSGPLAVFSNVTEERWTVSDVSFKAPLVAGDTLIAIHYDPGSVAGFDLETGAVKWRLKCDPLPKALLAVDENTLYVGIDSELVALRASDDESDEGEDTAKQNEKPDRNQKNKYDEMPEDGERQNGEDGDSSDDTDSDC